MKSAPRDFDRTLDEGLEDLRATELGEAETRAVLARVLARALAEEAASEAKAKAEPIRGCADFRALLPAYVALELPAARALLLEDHARECIPCRRALAAARAGSPLEAPAASDTTLVESRGARVLSFVSASATWLRGNTPLRFAAAAVLAIGLGAATWGLVRNLPLAGGETAAIEELEGQLFRLTDGGAVALAAGEKVRYGETVKSARGSSGVLRLADGTRIEMSARTEVALARSRRGTTLELGRGSVIVEAAKQKDGKLFVATTDCEVAVTGTIFAVNHGTKGSRVSVVEGRVVVDQGSRERVLDAGGQVSTSASLGAVPLAEEIAWSRNFERYVELLAELRALERAVDAAVGPRALRHSTTLLDQMPAGTEVYAAMPNIGEDLETAFGVLQERTAASPLLADWWRENVGEGERAGEIAAAVQKIGTFSRFLGEEVAFGFETEPSRFLLVAETNDPAGLRAFLAAELASWAAREGEQAPAVLLEQLSAEPAAGLLLFWVDPAGLLAVSNQVATLRELAAGDDAFVGSSFRNRLAAVYADGADWVVGADLEHLLDLERQDRREILTASGVEDAEHLVLERRRGEGRRVHYRAELAFAGPRHGLASWLAAPAPMGSLEFVSPDAHLVTAALAKEPQQLVDDLFALLDAVSPELRENVRAFETRHGVDVMADFAAPLGGELTFALDGPVLPTPSWKLIVEVYDPVRFTATLDWLVEHVNSAAETPWLRLERPTGSGRFYTLSSARGEVAVSFTFADGYLLMGPSEALLDQALAIRDSGFTLVRSQAFQALLPVDGEANFSGLTYQNLRAVLGPLADVWARTAGRRDTAVQRSQIEDVIEETPASIACVYGGEDRITFAGTSESEVFSGLAGLSGTAGLGSFLGELVSGTKAADETSERAEE